MLRSDAINLIFCAQTEVLLDPGHPFKLSFIFFHLLTLISRVNWSSNIKVICHFVAHHREIGRWTTKVSKGRGCQGNMKKRRTTTGSSMGTAVCRPSSARCLLRSLSPSFYRPYNATPFLLYGVGEANAFHHPVTQERVSLLGQL